MAVIKSSTDTIPIHVFHENEAEKDANFVLLFREALLQSRGKLFPNGVLMTDTNELKTELSQIEDCNVSLKAKVEIIKTLIEENYINFSGLKSLKLGREGYLGSFYGSTKRLHEEFTSIPSEIGYFTGLQSLGCSYCCNNSLPSEISNLTNLQHLDLCGNEFTTFPSPISNLTGLLSLNLSAPFRLSEKREIAPLSSEIGNLRSLQELKLNYYQVVRFPSEIGNLTNLKKLELDVSSIELPPEINSLINVQLIFISLLLPRDYIEQLQRWCPQAIVSSNRREENHVSRNLFISKVV